jgi:serine/threonine protein kinase
MNFGRFELGRQIASGGMAEVYTARYAGTQGFVKQLAVKRILARYSEDPEFIRLFIHEAKLAAKLHHANIVQIYDFDQVDGTYYIAMELVSGVDLRRLVDSHADADPEQGARIGLDLGVYVVAECLAGLMAAHEMCDSRGDSLGIIHRDVSPHNIMVSYSGEVKLTDFGIAKAIRGDDETPSRVIRGKLRYMSPEQALGLEIDQRSDLFSLGIVLWELATGSRLYGKEGERALGAKERQASIPDPSSLNCAVSPGLREVLNRMLHHDPGERYGSAREALGALRSEAGATDRSLELGELMEWLFPRESTASRRSSISSVLGKPGSAESSARTARVYRGANDGSSGRKEASESSQASSEMRSPSTARGRFSVSRREIRIPLMAVAIVLLAGVLAYLAIPHFTRRPQVSESPQELKSSQVSKSTPRRLQRRSPPRPAVPIARSPGRVVQRVRASAHRPSLGAASLEVLSTPAGAAIFIDRIPTGRRTPAVLGVPAGKHRVRVQWPDGRRVSRSQTCGADEKQRVSFARPKTRPKN